MWRHERRDGDCCDAAGDGRIIPLFVRVAVLLKPQRTWNSVEETLVRGVLFAVCGLLLGSVPALSADDPPGRSERFLIIHADDAGMCHSVNQGTIEALEGGLVKSCSIMMPCPWVSEFAEYARQHPEHCYGIHLALNSEWKHYKWGPVASRDAVPSLVDKYGYLWNDVPEVAANAKADEVEIELRAQIERAKQLGIPVSHLDTHMGALVSRPDLLEVYVKVGLDYGLPVLYVRDTREDFVKRYPTFAEVGPALLQALDNERFPVLDSLIQFRELPTHEERRAAYIDTLRRTPPGVHQLIIHCGVLDDELRHVTGSSMRRDSDRRIFTDPEIAQLIEDEGIKLLSWKAYHAMVNPDTGNR